MLTLAPLPSSVRTLTDEERMMLVSQHPDLQTTLDGCKTCKGKKSFCWKDDDGNPAEYECNCRDQFVLHRHLLYSGITYSYQRLGWIDARYVESKAKAKVMAYADEIETYRAAGIGLLLYGERGTGKTFLTTLILRRMISEGYDVFFTDIRDLIAHFKGTWRDQGRTTWFAKRIRNASLLGIDDLGREHDSIDVVEAMMDGLIRSRTASGRPTFITTNLDEKGLENRYSPNLMDLFTESMEGYEFTGPSYRENAKKLRVEEASLGLIRPIVLG